MTPGELASLLLNELRKPIPQPRKVLLCAQDVADALDVIIMTGGRAGPPSCACDYTHLLGIGITPVPDSAPGTWRLILHDHCEAVIEWEDEEHTRVDTRRTHVSHTGCTIAAEGQISPRRS
jgi:hypothetical protein